MNKCAECKVKFKNGARKIGCGFCGKWFHVDGNCTDINLQLYELLTKEDQLHWYCKSCNEIAPEVLGSLRKCIEENVQIRKTQEAMKTELEEFKQEGSLKDAVETIVREILEEYKAEIVEPERPNTDSIRDIAREVFEENKAEITVPERHNESIRNIARGEVRENNDKKGREANIVISNVDESIEAEDEVPQILAHLGVTVEVNEIRRMGRNKKKDYNRLIWVRLGNKKERNNVLDAAKKLKEEERWKNIYINKDMTEAEREQAYNLREELRTKRRQENANRGRSRYVIHRGRVVTRENQNEPQQAQDSDDSDDEEQGSD